MAVFPGFCRRSVALYNSLGHARQTAVRLYVSTPYIQLKDSLNNVVACQVEPFWTGDEAVSSTVFKVCPPGLCGCVSSVICGFFQLVSVAVFWHTC